VDLRILFPAEGSSATIASALLFNRLGSILTRTNGRPLDARIYVESVANLVTFLSHIFKKEEDRRGGGKNDNLQ